jgi:hypothetical protein
MRLQVVKVVVAGASLFAATLLACGAVASASGTTVPKSLVGCWHRRAPALPVGTAAGVWMMKITKSGELLAFTPGMTSCSEAPDFTGAISVAGGRLTIGPLPVCPARGTFTWKAAGRELTLEATRDGCPSRKLLFSGAWKRS